MFPLLNMNRSTIYFFFFVLKLLNIWPPSVILLLWQENFLVGAIKFHLVFILQQPISSAATFCILGMWISVYIFSLFIYVLLQFFFLVSTFNKSMIIFMYVDKSSKGPQLHWTVRSYLALKIIFKKHFSVKIIRLTWRNTKKHVRKVFKLDQDTFPAECCLWSSK